MALCRVEDVPGLSYGGYILGSWLLALVLGGTLWLHGRKHGRSAWRAAGVAVMSLPAWMALLPVVPDMLRTVCERGNVVAVVQAHGIPAPPSWEAFLSQAVNAAERNILYPFAGLLLYLHGLQRDGELPATGHAQLHRLAPMGRSIAGSFRLGAALFPLLAALNLILVSLLGLSFLATGDSLYANMTAVAALALALAAGFGEEIVYRGVMQQGLKRVLRPILPGRGVAVGVAIVLQSIPFAYAHAGYGNPTLLLFNVAFAVLAGLVVERWGLGCAIALHALIDLYAFFVGTPAPDPWFWALIVVATGAVLFAGLVEVRRRVDAWRANRG